ncbi:unnamed protein product, partial [Nesidiocoris tenuis]
MVSSKLYINESTIDLTSLDNNYSLFRDFSYLIVASIVVFQVEVECSTEHPYFVYGQGWASCNPERTLITYGLKVHQLQVGDVCISLSPRPGAVVQPVPTTSMSAPTSVPSPASSSQPSNMADRKRRWSAPDDIHDQPGQQPHPPPQ